jgi:membrane dipeptidase
MMTRLAAVLVFAAAASHAAAAVDPERVERLLEHAVVIDLHADTTQLILDEGYNLAELHSYGQVDIPRMRRGRVAAMFFASNPDSRRLTPLESMKRALDEVDAIRRETMRHPTDLVPAVTAGQIIAAKKQGKIAILIGMEGGHVIDSDLAVLRSFYELGARYMTLTHFTHTPWADSSGQPPAHNGLTDFGRQVVQEMNRLGMMVDVSHVSDKTFWDALAASTAPVIASHSSCRVFSNHVRNMSDDMPRALAKNGGVIHINYYNDYLDQDFLNRDQAYSSEKDRKAREDAREADRARDPRRRGDEQRKANAARIARLGRVPLSRLLDHFEHAVQVAGIDHVGLGSDFDGSGDQFPEGMEDISKIPNLVRGLMERGFSDRDIEKILGGNTLRVMRQVEQEARRLQAAHRF